MNGPRQPRRNPLVLPSPAGDVALNLAKVSLHYFKNNLFMEDNEILANLHKIAHIPIKMVHGGTDMIVLPCGAQDIARAHPDARLTIVDGAAHASSEPGLFAALCEASERMYRRLTAASIFPPAPSSIF